MRDITPRLLLVSGVPPGDRNVGQIILRDLVRTYPIGQLVCFATPSPRYLYAPAQGLESLPVTCVPRRYENAYRPGKGIFANLVALFFTQIIFRRYVDRLAKSAHKLAFEQKIQKIWVVLDSATTIAMAPLLKKSLALPMITLVWDPPEYLARKLRLDRYSKRWLLKRFARALASSDRTAVVSETMRKDYNELYGANTMLLRHATPSYSIKTKPCADRDTFYFGFCGSLYGKTAWDTFIASLDALKWELRGKKVIVRVLGANICFRTNSRANIEYLGWRNSAETISILADCDATYLPYPFETSLAGLVRYAFPSKLSTYVAAGRPVFIHAPRESSLARFYEIHPVGECCTSLEIDRIVKSLHSLIDDPSVAIRADQEIRRVAAGVLSYDNFVDQFSKFVEIDKSHLFTDGQQAVR